MEAWIKQTNDNLFEVKTEDETVWTTSDSFYRATQICNTVQYFLDTCENLRNKLERQKEVLLTDIVP